MHNNGTNRLILPQRGPILSSVAPPPAGVKIEVNQAGVLITPFAGETSIPMQLEATQAMQLGINLISAAALYRHSVGQLAQAAEITPDPNAHELTGPPIIID